MPGMFHVGDRVLVLTPYGELPACIMSIEGPELYAVWPNHPAYTNRIFARDAELRRPIDFAADERGKVGPRLVLAQPAIDQNVPEPASTASAPAPRRLHAKGVRWNELVD